MRISTSSPVPPPLVYEDRVRDLVSGIHQAHLIFELWISITTCCFERARLQLGFVATSAETQHGRSCSK